MRLPWRRLAAWLIDWACALVWVAVVAAVGVPLYLAGITHSVNEVTLNVVGALTVVIPITVGLALLEASRYQATLGKRVLKIHVIRKATDGTTPARVSFGRALLRNALKIALPWIIGHAAVVAIVSASGHGSVPASVWVLTAVAYLLPLLYVGSLFIRKGRTPYDLVSHTSVVLLPRSLQRESVELVEMEGAS